MNKTTFPFIPSEFDYELEKMIITLKQELKVFKKK